ncbi:CoxG family protein [Streptomyces pathocidini]|uniref:CoxG family protein n=1 Tax=Streptomyces pathocidini TaxID=1650571 RepID=A0ABW7UNP1_9ACTN
MEHEVFVPFSADTVRQALADPGRVSRAVPGFQRGADGPPDAPSAHSEPGPVDLSGRLKLRVGASTITYRGGLRVTELDSGDFAVEGGGTEARGGGSVKLAMSVRVSAADGGSVLACTGTVSSDGRLTAAGDAASAVAGRRLLDRFAARLTSGLESDPIGQGDPGDDNRRVIPGIPAPEKPSPASPPDASADRGTNGSSGASGASDASGASGGQDGPAGSGTSGSPGTSAASAAQAEGNKGNEGNEGNGEAGDEGAGKSEGEPAGDAGDGAAGELNGGERDGGADEDGGLDEEGGLGENGGLDEDGGLGEELKAHLENEPPAEAAHARRTMIGRSAEEVDHAPPRGRYAPVPAPEPATATATLRWAAPAAAALLASAVVVSRVLRRRR